MNLKEVKRVVSGIKGSLFKNSNSFSIGMLKSHFRGSGLKFKEHRLYGFGDDTRFIDWKMVARTNKTYIKTFEEDRGIEITIVLDLRQTMYLGDHKVTKLQAAIEICCFFYLLSIETGDKIHIMLVADEIYNLPLSSGEKGIAQLVSTLQKKNILCHEGLVNRKYSGQFKNSNEGIKKIMSRSLGRYIAKENEVVILSDLNNLFLDGEIEKITCRRNIHCFQILCLLDEMKSASYSLLLDVGNQNTAGSGLVNLKAKKSLGHQFSSKRIKQIKIHERYLENFIKDMM